MAHWLDGVLKLLEASTDDPIELARMMGRDPKAFYKGANFRNADFCDLDLSLLGLDVEEPFGENRVTKGGVHLAASETSEIVVETNKSYFDYIGWKGSAPGDVEMSSNWPQWREFVPYIENASQPDRKGMEILHGRWLSKLAYFYTKIGDFEKTLRLCEQSEEILSKVLPESHEDIRNVHFIRGVALTYLTRLAEAESTIRHVVNLDESYRPETLMLSESYDEFGRVHLEKGRAGDRGALTEALRAYQKSAAILRRHVSRASEARAHVLNSLGGVRDELGQSAAALRLSEYALAIWRKILPEGDARLGYGLINTGSMALTSGAVDRAEPLLEKALALWQAVYLEAPKHPEIVSAADWLVSCYLVRARAGENRGVREMKARQLCDAFGFDYDTEVEQAKLYPYTPG